MKNYVYKTNFDGRIFANLDGAITHAVDDIKEYGFLANRHTNPMVSKINGGYMVLIADIHGQIRRRTIDVFEPDKSESNILVHMDETYEKNNGCENTDNDDEEDDEDGACCVGCGEYFDNRSDLIKIDGDYMCKDCAIEHIEENY